MLVTYQQIAPINHRAFTLIELLVAFAIIGVLSAIVLVSINKIQANGRDAQRSAQIKQIQNALEMYYSDHGAYPLSYHQVTLPAGCAAYDIESNDVCEWNAFKNALAPYLSSLPVDPLNTTSYYYHYFSGYYGPLGKWYYLTYRVENQNSVMEQSDGANSWGCQGYFMDNVGTIELGKTHC